MARNLSYDGEIEIFPEGYSSDKYAVAFTIRYDFSPGRPATYCRNNGDPGDPPEPAEVCVNSVKLRVNGEPVDCPAWLEQLILDAMNEETLMEHAMEDAW